MSKQNNIISLVRNKLKQNVEIKTKNSFQRFFKEKVKYYGVKSAIVAKIAKENFQEIKNYPKEQIFVLCEELLKSGYGEEAWIAANWTDRINDKFEENDFEIFEGWIHNYIDDWAKCDTFCNHAVAAFIEKCPQFIDKLKTWTKSKNRWLKRASAVTLIIPARRGKFLKDIFKIADSLLLDPDDMVQKGYGWMLKAASESHQKEVFDFVIQHKKNMPRTALRYAIEKMPPALRKKAMEKL